MKVLLVVVLYKERLFKTDTYRTLLENNSRFRLFVYDNSPKPMHSPHEFEEGKVVYISDTQNPGLGVAYNKAAEYAKTENIDWILLADQDTSFAVGIMEDYCEAVRLNPGIKLFVPPMQIADGKYISPVRMCFHMARPSRKVPGGIVSLKRYAAINSGMLIHVEAFWNVGGYNDAVMLDYADYQFLDRFKRKYEEFYVLASTCHQNFSNDMQDASRKLQRFVTFCRSLKNCEKHGFVDRLSYHAIVFKRMLSLAVRIKTLSPIGIVMKNYL